MSETEVQSGPALDHRGRVTVYDTCDGTQRQVYPIDAAEMLRLGTATMTPPAPQPVAAPAALSNGAANPEPQAVTEPAAKKSGKKAHAESQGAAS